MTDGGAQSIPPPPGWTSVPLGVAYFPAEICRLPKLYVSFFCSMTHLTCGRTLTGGAGEHM